MAQRAHYEHLCGRLYRVAVSDPGALMYPKAKPKSGHLEKRVQ